MLKKEAHKRSLPIGLFDSGVGGLSVLRELARSLPEEKFIYLADSMHLPLGDKKQDEIVEYAKEAAFFLWQQNIKLLVIACNTSSSLALDALQKLLPIPVMGVIYPTVEKAVLLKKEKMKIAVLATQATVKSGVYSSELSKKMPEAEIFEVACPLLVPLIEKGDLASLELEKAVEFYLKPFVFEHKIDLLILGCTHYAWIFPLFQKHLPGVEIIDAALPTALAVQKALAAKKLIASKQKFYKIVLQALKKKRFQFFLSSKNESTDSFQKRAEALLGKKIEKVLRKDNNFIYIQKSIEEVSHGV